ncbi:hypothetical protein FB446DRAFT_772802 [Lentinula raphanica]|nr:hypothetical protein FB446DRAFT_772802 [Lentinula raphanica]
MILKSACNLLFARTPQRTLLLDRSGQVGSDRGQNVDEQFINPHVLELRDFECRQAPGNIEGLEAPLRKSGSNGSSQWIASCGVQKCSNTRLTRLPKLGTTKLWEIPFGRLTGGRKEEAPQQMKELEFLLVNQVSIEMRLHRSPTYHPMNSASPRSSIIMRNQMMLHIYEILVVNFMSKTETRGRNQSTIRPRSPNLKGEQLSLKDVDVLLSKFYEGQKRSSSTCVCLTQDPLSRRELRSDIAGTYKKWTANDLLKVSSKKRVQAQCKLVQLYVAPVDF